MIARVVLFSSLVLAPSAGEERFPSMTGETASGKAVTIPAAGGKPTVLALAYGKGAQKELEEWYEPAYLRFIAKHGLMASAYDCDVWFVPVFVGMNKAAYDPTMNRFRKSAEPEIVDHVLFFKGEFDAIREQLGLKRNDTPYFFVLDAEGRIIHRTEGAFSDDKLEAMEEALLGL